jgi:hypothetical protein
MQLVERLPSGIGDRTLVSYEHGKRQLTVAHLVELSGELGIPVPVLLHQALQKEQLELQKLELRVNLRAFLTDPSDRFRPMRQWARNHLIEKPRGVVKPPPVAVRELAAFLAAPTLTSRITSDVSHLPCLHRKSRENRRIDTIPTKDRISRAHKHYVGYDNVLEPPCEIYARRPTGIVEHNLPPP